MSTWRDVAYELAERLRHANYCSNEHQTWQEGVEEGCPNCADRKAYAGFVAKVGFDPFKQAYTGTTVSVVDLYTGEKSS